MYNPLYYILTEFKFVMVGINRWIGYGDIEIKVNSNALMHISITRLSVTGNELLFDGRIYHNKQFAEILIYHEVILGYKTYIIDHTPYFI